MRMKLYAGYIEGNYEYAVWAANRHSVAQIMNMSLAMVNRYFLDQSRNPALKVLMPDKSKVYRTPLDTPEPDWQPWRSI